MTQSVPDPDSYRSALSSYLQDLLPSANVREAELGKSHEPILLLHTDHVLAAFAFSKEDVRQSFSTIYGDFKEYYRQHDRDWDKLDLAFVFCLAPQLRHFYEFFSAIETDVYFCRKFVVPIAEPINQSVAHLPFLPLAPLAGQPLRPLSAQTFLQNCGVQSTLAKYIVVPGVPGTEKIADDCLSGDFGKPTELKPTQAKAAQQLDSLRRPVTIENITIQNFRAYRKPLTFHFGRDVTVLYGANGFGKTSFFDAFDFVTTGDVGRITFQREDDFETIIPHLDSSSDDSSVSLSFLHENAIRTLVRTVKRRQYAQLDGFRSDRKRVLTELTGGNFSVVERLDNFVRLFRATHLFNQEHPELTKEFENDCRLPADIVARMLAFEDYASAISRAGKIREQLTRAINKASTHFNDLTLQINDEKEQLARLNRVAATPVQADALDRELQTIRKSLDSLAISTNPGTPDAAEVRGWRASLEARLEESLSRGARLSGLVSDIPILSDHRSVVAELRKQIAEIEKALSDADVNKTSAQVEIRDAKDAIKAVTQALIEARNRTQAFEWFRGIKPELQRLQQQRDAALGNLKKANDSLLQRRRAFDLLTQEVAESANTEKLKYDQKRFTDEQLGKAESLLKSLAVWSENDSRIRTIVDLEETRNDSQESLLVEAAALASTTEELLAEERLVATEVAGIEEHQSEMTELIAQLLDHIHTGTCPLCGDEHGSRENLLAKIKAHGSVDIAIDARTRLGNVRSRLNKHRQETTLNLQKQRDIQRELTDFEKERNALAAANGRIVQLAQDLGLVIAPHSESAAQIQSFVSRTKSESDLLNAELKELVTTSSSKRRELELLKDAVDNDRMEVERLSVLADRLEQQTNQIHADPRASQVSLASGDQEIANLYAAEQASIADLTTKLSKLQNDSAEREAKVAKYLNEIGELNEHLAKLRPDLANRERAISDFLARLAVFGLDEDSNSTALQKKIAEESKLQAQIRATSDKASGIEIAIDTATTAAALTQLQQNIKNREKSAAAAKETQRATEPWLKFFEQISDLLSTQQNQAIANFTKEYGPRTSVIQRRLRSVYGFDDIEIQSDKSEILVRATRNGQALKPSQFFSQSQQQTLFLGLFLTACISQTWSAFAPIFLDDPVTHFDDLNTYAFLDLIVGLLESDSWKKQFVISTCDEKLMQLARQKFRHLGDSARFYRFVAIGEDGPVIEELPV